MMHSVGNLVPGWLRRTPPAAGLAPMIDFTQGGGHSLPLPYASLNNEPADSWKAPQPSVRSMTPRQMRDLSLELYLAVMIDREEQAMLAFQPELDPDYDCTIGSLTGEPAEPDRPRDYIRVWEDRLEFERKRRTRDTRTIQHVTRILSVLRELG